MNHELVKLCLDASRGVATNFSSARDVSEVIRKEFIEILGTATPDHRTFRKHKAEIFEIIEVVLDEIITESITGSPFFDQFVEYRDLNLGDTNEFYAEDEGMLVISEIADGHLNLRRQKLDVGTSYTVGTKTYGAKVYGDFLRFISGRLDWAGLVRKIDEAMRVKMAGDIYTQFMGASAYLPTEFKATGTFSDTAFSNLVQHVQAVNGQAPVIVAGTKNGLKKINGAFTSSSFLVSESMKDQLNSKGVLNVYEGVPLLEIPQVHIPNTFNFKLDDTKLLILPANTKPIKVVREGQSIIVENNNGNPNMDMSLEHTFITKYGIQTVFNKLYGAYTVS